MIEIVFFSNLLIDLHIKHFIIKIFGLNFLIRDKDLQQNLGRANRTMSGLLFIKLKVA